MKYTIKNIWFFKLWTIFQLKPQNGEGVQVKGGGTRTPCWGTFEQGMSPT